MITMNRQQRRAHERKMKQQQKKNIPGYSPKQHAFKTGVVFNWQEELGKLVKMINNPRATAPVYCSESDWSCRYNQLGDAGFLMIALKKTNGGLPLMVPYDTVDVQSFVAESKALVDASFSQYEFKEHFVFKTYCTKDVAYKHFKNIFDRFQIAFAGYSTPEYILSLCEDPDLF